MGEISKIREAIAAFERLTGRAAGAIYLGGAEWAAITTWAAANSDYLMPKDPARPLKILGVKLFRVQSERHFQVV